MLSIGRGRQNHLTIRVLREYAGVFDGLMESLMKYMTENGIEFITPHEASKLTKRGGSSPS